MKLGGMGMGSKIECLQSISPAGFGDVLRRRRCSNSSISIFPAHKSVSITSSNIGLGGGGGGGWKVKGPATTTITCRSHHLIADFAPASSAAYGLLLLGGGLFAYKKSGSKGSLLGGLSGATLMAAAYFFMQASETKEIGDAITFGSALLFASVFGIRFTSTRKLIPSALLLGISIGVMMVSVSAYLQDRLM